MERAPGKLPNTSSRLIAMAASLADMETVREFMHCSPENFDLYRDGVKEPPFQEFDRLVTFIVLEQRKIIAKNSALLAKIRARRHGSS